ncbi:MAG: DotU family type IV/VI secretion system protein [Nitrospirae bacterium]|nr:DotU family type IV/VI secretion system protein [Nitrospirota bacterium]
MATPVSDEKTRLPDLFADLFILATHVKNARDLGHSETLRLRIIEMFEAVDRKGKNLGIPGETLQQARYAMAAFLDEMILSSSWPNKEQWSARPLQYEFFREQVAGVEFFNRLEAIRRAYPANADLLEVYYLCLILGFEGQYKIHGTEKLKGLVEDLSREIQSRRGEVPHLSPHGKRSDELIEMVKRELPSWIVVVSCVAVVFFFYIILSFMMNYDASEAVRDLKQLVEGRR